MFDVCSVYSWYADSLRAGCITMSMSLFIPPLALVFTDM